MASASDSDSAELGEAARNPQLERQLCDAIRAHLVVRLAYDHEPYRRTFEPYIVYRSEQDHVLVGGTQTRDDSQPGVLGYLRPEHEVLDVVGPAIEAGEEEARESREREELLMQGKPLPPIEKPDASKPTPRKRSRPKH